MATNNLKIIFGTAGIDRFTTEGRSEVLSLLKDYHVTNLDTAHIYGDSQQVLSDINASSSFTVDTKSPGFQPGILSKESVTTAGENSHKLLKEIETYYLHSPDHSTPLAETLEAVQALYKKGVFKLFGLSNFSPEEVQQVYDTAKEKGYVLPTVYQGNYNLLSRKQENTLFPVLRKLGIRFYAYSPIAGGFLAKKAESFDVGKSGEGRFDADSSPAGKLYNKLYNTPTLLTALRTFHSLASTNSLPPAELAYRWIVYHSSLDPSAGDGVIIGASRPAQLKETLEGIAKGPLSEDVVKGVDKVWEEAKDGAPIDNFYH